MREKGGGGVVLSDALLPRRTILQYMLLKSASRAQAEQFLSVSIFSLGSMSMLPWDHERKPSSCWLSLSIPLGSFMIYVSRSFMHQRP